MISDKTEDELKQTGLLELWGLGFTPSFAAIYGCWLYYGFHWPQRWYQEDVDLWIFGLLVGYAIAGVAAAWMSPHHYRASNDFLSYRRRAAFALFHVAICGVVLLLLLCVGPQENPLK